MIGRELCFGIFPVYLDTITISCAHTWPNWLSTRPYHMWISWISSTSIIHVDTYLCILRTQRSLVWYILDGYWDFIATEDINQKLSICTLYFLADFSSLIVISVCLWYSFKINIFKIILDLQQEFWPVFTIILGSLLTQVSWYIHQFSVYLTTNTLTD